MQALVKKKKSNTYITYNFFFFLPNDPKQHLITLIIILADQIWISNKLIIYLTKQ